MAGVAISAFLFTISCQSCEFVARPKNQTKSVYFSSQTEGTPERICECARLCRTCLFSFKPRSLPLKIEHTCWTGHGKKKFESIACQVFGIVLLEMNSLAWESEHNSPSEYSGDLMRQTNPST